MREPGTVVVEPVGEQGQQLLRALSPACALHEDRRQLRAPLQAALELVQQGCLADPALADHKRVQSRFRCALERLKLALAINEEIRIEGGGEQGAGREVLHLPQHPNS